MGEFDFMFRADQFSFEKPPQDPANTRESLDETDPSVEKTKPFDLKFYVTDHSADNEDTGNPERLRELYTDIKKDGVTSVRYDWHWNKVEAEQENFEADRLTRYRQAVEIMHESGLEPPTVILSNIPKWALEIYRTDKESFFNEYRKYVEVVKNHLVDAAQKTGEVVSRVQILNELNNTVYTPIDPADIPRFCEITRDVFRDYNPKLQLVGTLFAGNLPEVIKKVTFGKANFGVPIETFLETQKEALQSLDVIAVDYYPGMWHIPLSEAIKNKKEIFKQLGLLERSMETIAGWGKEYELGEVGIQTNMPWMGKRHNEDRQRYFYDVFFRAFKQMLLDFQRREIPLPTRVGLYEALDEPPKNVVGKILRTLTPFPEHDLGMRRADVSRKEILQGKRHVKAGSDRGDSQLSKIIRYLNKPVIKK